MADTLSNTTEVELTFTHTTVCGVKLLGYRQLANDLHAELDMREVLSECCAAARTGTIAGLVCKDCGEPVPYVGLTLFDELVARCSDKGCPIPVECAENALWSVSSVLDDQTAATYAS